MNRKHLLLLFLLILTVPICSVHGQSNKNREARLASSYVGRVILSHEKSLLDATDWPDDANFVDYLDSLQFARDYLLQAITATGQTKMDSILLDGIRYKPDSMSRLERCSILYDRKTELLNIYVRIDTYANRMKWLAASEAYDKSGCE